MKRSSLFRHYFPLLLSLLVPAFLVLIVFAVKGGRLVERQGAADLAVTSAYAARLFTPLIQAEDRAPLALLCRELGQVTETRITVFGLDGAVVGDTVDSPERLGHEAERPEVQEALAGRRGEARRYSYTRGRDMVYVAAPLVDGVRIVGAVRVAAATVAADRYRTLALAFGLCGVLSLVAGTLLAWWLMARRLRGELLMLRQGAEVFADARLAHRIPAPRSTEVAEVAEAMNRMAAALGEQLRELRHRHNEQQAVLSSMWGAVIAIDHQERLLDLNQAAAELFELDLQQVKGRPIQGVLRNLDLQRFLSKTLASDRPVEGEVVMRDGSEERYLQAHGTHLRDESGATLGALVVLNDVTKLRRLERIRRDFVANVSHELRTPITSIRGFVETLLDGGLDDPEQAYHFLTIVARQSASLNAIIEDLLSLSRLEREAEQEGVALEPGRLRSVLSTAVETCLQQAAAKEVAIRLECPPKLSARINASLLGQAVVNLVSNAVKHSDPGGEVAVTAGRDPDRVWITVQDHGCGIAREHLNRLFERFYRVDKGRSRNQGGTGLGLAIVKHIVLAHNGRVSVASEPGRGTTFTIELPV